MLQYPDAVSEICAAFAALVRRRRRASDRRRRGRSDHRRGHPGVRDRRQLGLRGMFAEEVKDLAGTTRREFRRGFHLEPGSRVLLVDDILTTGGSLLTMLPPIEASGAQLVRTAVIVDRSGGTHTITSPATGRDLSGRGALDARHPDLRAWRQHMPSVCRGATCRGAWLERHEGAVLTPLGCAVYEGGPTTASIAVCSSSAPMAPSNLAASLPSASTTKT